MDIREYRSTTMWKHLDDRNLALEALAAELTNAAYPVLLEVGLGGSWVDLEIGLWKGLARTLSHWLRELPQGKNAEDDALWRNGLLTGLVHSALVIARQQGISEPLSYLRPGLREAFRSAMGHSQPLTLHRPILGAYP
jgi:hypothetical protein